MWIRVALMVLLLGASGSALAEARRPEAKVTETYRIEGKQVSQAEFTARLRTLEGQAEYHCKQTTFGGVVTFKAHDARGHWFRVTQVSGSDRPSSIEPTEAPASPAAGE